MKLCIPLEIWQQMCGYTHLSSPNEITGIGTITFHGQDLLVDQIFVPKQIVSPGYCETDKGALNEIIFNLVEDDPARAGKLRFRWHSHAESSVFWSATDEKDINAWQGPWVANLVMNVRDEYLARLDLFDGLRVSNIPLDVSICTPVPTDILKACEQEISKRVKVYRAPNSIPPAGDLKTGTVASYRDLIENLSKGGDENANK